MRPLKSPEWTRRGHAPSGSAADGVLHRLATLTYARLASFVRPAIVNGAAGVVVAPGGQPFSVMAFTIRDGRIVAIEALSDRARLAQLGLTILEAVLDDEQDPRMTQKLTLESQCGSR